MKYNVNGDNLKGNHIIINYNSVIKEVSALNPKANSDNNEAIKQ